jgi:hypothetical protein
MNVDGKQAILALIETFHLLIPGCLGKFSIKAIGQFGRWRGTRDFLGR